MLKHKCNQFRNNPKKKFYNLIKKQLNNKRIKKIYKTTANN